MIRIGIVLAVVLACCGCGAGHQAQEHWEPPASDFETSSASSSTTGAVDYKMSAAFAEVNNLSEEQQNLVTFVPARDSEEARTDAMFYCNGLRQWQDETPGPTSPHRCVRR